MAVYRYYRTLYTVQSTITAPAELLLINTVRCLQLIQ